MMYIVVLEDKVDYYMWVRHPFENMWDAMHFAVKNHYKFVKLQLQEGIYYKTIYNILLRKSEDNYIFCLDCRIHE